jgi:hypothetical protein
MISCWFFQSASDTPGRPSVFPAVLSFWFNDITKTPGPSCLEPVFFCVQAVSAVLFEEELKRGGLVILSWRRIWMSVLIFFAKDAQNDRGCGLVILSLRRICTPTRRFFAKEAQNDKGCGL